jgi:hypothetical protein
MSRNMSRILLIEPDRMLRHALTVALFSEHRVKSAQAVPDGAAKDFDLLIVDAAALQERNLLSAREREKLKAWKLPLLWIGADGTLPESDRDRWARLKSPLTQEIVRRAVAHGLAASVGAAKVIVEQTAPLPVEAPAIAQPKARKKKTGETADGKKIIELVEIVDDTPA